jgi:hypothetical protein
MLILIPALSGFELVSHGTKLLRYTGIMDWCCQSVLLGASLVLEELLQIWCMEGPREFPMLQSYPEF